MQGIHFDIFVFVFHFTLESSTLVWALNRESNQKQIVMNLIGKAHF